MKRLLMLSAIVVAGCNTSVNPTATEDAPTLDLLSEGSAEACNREDVRTTLLQQIKPTIRPVGDQISQDVEGGMSLVTYSFDTIALAGVDKAIKSVSCDANLTIKYKDHEDRTFQVRYTIRPSVEDKQAFVINTVAPEAMQYAKAASEDAVTSVVGDRLKNSQREEETEETQISDSTETAAEPEWTAEQSSLISEWNTEMRNCDPAADETQEVRDACTRLEDTVKRMKSAGICTVDVPDTDAVQLRHCS